MERTAPSETPARLPTGLPADPARRMRLARLSGATSRWCWGDLRDEPDEARMAALLDISTDPAVWGVILGSALLHLGRGSTGYARVVEVARTAGADEQVAAVHLAWLRAQPGL